MKPTDKAFPPVTARRSIPDDEHVFNELKQMLMIGEFVPGQKLTLPQLAEAFGTSQMPIREATNRLITARALQAPPRRSLIVPEATTQLIDSILPLRLLLEGEATRLAASATGSELVAELEAINSEMVTAAAIEDLKLYLRLNQKFHFLIYRNCGNPDLIDLIELLWMRYAPLLNIVRSGVLSQAGTRRHDEIVDGLRRKDAEATADAMRNDITDAALPIRRLIEARENNPAP